jgi:thiol-disulfide isomerase/thioredoxin
MEQVNNEYGPRGLAILAVNIQEGRQTAARFAREKKVTSRVLLDLDGSVTVAYRVTGTPTVVLVGRDGRLVGRAVGPRPWTSEAGRALLEALLKAPGG